VFKGEEYTVIIYFKIDPSNEKRYIEPEDADVFIDVDRLIVCIGVEKITYEEEYNRHIKEYGHIYEEFNIPLENVRKPKFDYTDYKYVFRDLY
jgi:hypothetical protein